MTKKVRTYSDEFKAEAVKKISDNNGNISATAKQLGIAMQTLSNWHNKANQGKLVGTEQYDPDLMSALQEIKQLKQLTPAVKSVQLNLGDFSYAA
jgi:transposase